MRRFDMQRFDMQRFDRAHIALCLTLAGLFAAPADARAQSLDGVALGARVRVEIPAVERPRPGHERQQSVAGTLEAIRGDTLWLLVGPGAASLRVPRGSIHRLYVSHGRPTRWQAALRGAIAPALVGAAASAVGTSIHRKQDGPRLRSVVASSAAWGAASGAALGAWSQRERWHRLALPEARSPDTAVTDARTALPNDD